MRLGERTEHLLEALPSRDRLHNAKGVHRKGREANGVAAVTGTTQLNLLVILQLLAHQRSAQGNPVLPGLQRSLKCSVIVWPKTAGPDMNDVEDDTASTLTQNRTGQLCLQGTRPRPRAEIRQLWVQRRLINPQQHHIIRRGNRTTPLKKNLPSRCVKTREQRQQAQGQ